jgi:MFS family permease
MALIARSVFTLYPRRTVLCFALFIGQAFLYNAFFFTYGDTLTTFLGVKQTGWYIAVFAASNFLGALLLSPLFDTVGRVRMIAGTYIVSGILLAITGVILGSLTACAAPSSSSSPRRVRARPTSRSAKSSRLRPGCCVSPSSMQSVPLPVVSPGPCSSAL